MIILTICLKIADLIVAATDDRDTQRRLARRALALDLPAVLPALYGDSGGEVFVQRSSRNPCFFCWDGYRTMDERLRGVTALNTDTLAILQLSVQLSLGVLDRASVYASLMAAPGDDLRPFQLFIQRPLAALEMAPQSRRPNCPSCAVGPAAHIASSTPASPPQQPQSPAQSQSAKASRYGDSDGTGIVWAIIIAIVVIYIAVWNIKNTSTQHRAAELSHADGIVRTALRQFTDHYGASRCRTLTAKMRATLYGDASLTGCIRHEHGQKWVVSYNLGTEVENFSGTEIVAHAGSEATGGSTSPKIRVVKQHGRWLIDEGKFSEIFMRPGSLGAEVWH